MQTGPVSKARFIESKKSAAVVRMEIQKEELLKKLASAGSFIHKLVLSGLSLKTGSRFNQSRQEKSYR